VTENNIRTGLFLVRFVGAVYVRLALLFLLVVAIDQFLGGLACMAARVGAIRVLFGLLLRPTLAAVSAACRVLVSVVVVLIVFVVCVLLLRRHPASPTYTLHIP